MFNKSNNKVKFQDQQLDDYVLENSVLKSKLQSKIDALSIMSKELDKCSMERDRYKVLVEQLKCIKPVMQTQTPTSPYQYNLTIISGGEMLAKTRDHNNMLKLEVEMLRSKLEEATGDIAALRKQLQRREMQIDEINGYRINSTTVYSSKDYEELVKELEKVHKTNQQIQLDYCALLDEKEELISNRDYYKSKVQRQNLQISYILANQVRSQQSDNGIDPPKPIVDLDAMVTENKYLHERITQLQVEKEIIKRTLTKYKTLLDNRNKNESLRKGFADVMNQKQVREFLDINSKNGLKRASATELKSVCLGLFEALNDKSIALQHHRKTNQILAHRINELEKTMEGWCNGNIPMFPSKMLLEEFVLESESTKSEEIKDKDLKKADESTNNLKGIFSDSYENRGSSEESGDNGINEESGDNGINEESGDNGINEESGDNGINEDVGSDCGEQHSITSKTVLPFELEQLVKEALAELKPEA